MELNESSDECIVVVPSSPTPALDPETPKRSTSKVRVSKAESAQRKSEREAKRVEEEALKAEKKRQKDELKAKRAEEMQLEKAKKAEELQQEKLKKAEERARKLEEQQQEKAKKAEELLQEKARKAEELLQEKARKAEEKAKKEAENADKKAELNKKKEQKQAAAQKQEMLNKQMANYMGKFFKPVEKSSGKDGQNNQVTGVSLTQRCTDEFDQIVSKQDTQFVSNIFDELKTMKKLETDFQFRTRLNSDSNSVPMATTSDAFLIKTRYIHFPEKYFNRPPYYGSFKKALAVQIDPLKPTASIDNVDYTFDSEGEWEEPCKDGEEIRSDAEDLSDSEALESDSDSDSFIVPHGHLSDDELNEDEQQQSTSTKQAREAAKSHVWDKKVARRTQQKELKPIFGCLNDPSLEEKVKSELSTFLHQFRRIFVPKELCLRVEEDDQQTANGDESAVKEEKTKRVSKKKSLISKKGLANDSTPTLPMVTMNSPTTAKRTGSASNIVEGASPSKRRKMNLNENCSIVALDDFDVQMSELPSPRPVVQVVRLSSADVESFSTSKSNNVLDEVKTTTSPLTVISNESTPSGCTLLIPKRKSTAI